MLGYPERVLEFRPNQKASIGLEVIKSLCCRIDLIVIFAARKSRKLAHIGITPGSRTGQQHATTLEFRSLGIQTQDFV